MMECVDLFSGAGGLSAGLERAGWGTVVAVDSDADCIATLRENQSRSIPIASRRGTYLRNARLLQADVCDLRAADLRPLDAPRNWRPDLLAGGPPCQPFSFAGRQLSVKDPRGRLFLEFVRLTSELRPRFVLFENVAGIVTAKGERGQPGEILSAIQDAFEGLGYACRFALLNAADYGAAQRRVRMFMIATCNRALPEFPALTHAATPREGDLYDRRAPWGRLGDFLSALPAPPVEEIVRPHAALAAQLASLRPGTGLRAGGIVEANRPGGHWGYRQDRFVADLSVPARTIRAAATPDWVRLDDGSVRRLALSECSALQGFPTSWSFVGTVASRFRQVGNAVQGDVAAAIGRILLAAAKSEAKAKPQSAPWPANFHKRIRYTAMEHVTNGAVRAAARAT